MSLLNPPKPFLQTNAWQQQQANSLRYNTSQAGSVLPYIYGTTRQAVNLIDFGDYRGPQGKKGKAGPLPIQGQHVGKGGGGGGKKGVGGKKNNDFSIDVAFALCQGPVSIGATNFVWSSAGVAFFPSIGLNLYTGTYTQTADPIFVGLGHNIAYAGTCYVTGTPMDLGPSPALPNLSFEITGFVAGTAGPDYPKDANPAAIVSDFLTDAFHGVGFPSANLDPNLSTTYGTYCQAAQLVMSPALQVQTEAAAWLNELMKLTNSALVWSGALLKIIPYGDLSISANGASWTPNLIPEYSFNDNDFLLWTPHLDTREPQLNEDGPVLVDRVDPSDVTNWVSIEYLDRANFYNKNVVPQFDQGMIDLYGLKTEPSIQGNCFCEATPASISARLILQRSLYVRNKYKFQVGWQYMLLEPMDIVLITDVYCNIVDQPVRIAIIEENKNGDFTITAEEIAVSATVPPPGLCAGEPASWRLSSPRFADLEAMPPDRLDSSGRLYATDPYGTVGGHWTIYDDNGTITSTITYGELWDKIFAFAGVFHDSIFGEPFNPDLDYSQYYKLCPILDGQYILAFMQRVYLDSDYAFWWAILDPNSLDVLGAYYVVGLLIWPYTNGIHVLEALTGDQLILVQCYAFLGATTAILGALPSANEFIAGTSGGDHGDPFRIRNTLIYPITNADFSANLMLANSMQHNKSRNFGTVLLAADGTPNLYIYVNREVMDVTAAGGAFVDTEIKNVIQPANPLGCMIKIPLGDVTFNSLSATDLPGFAPGTFYGAASGPYSIDNGNWTINGLFTAIPFTDEYTYISDNTVGGDDVYSLQTGVINRGGGKFWVIFYMVGRADAHYRTSDPGLSGYVPPIYERVRVFEYIQSIEKAQQIALATCVLHDDSDLPPDSDTNFWESSNDDYQMFSIIDDGGTANLYIHGFLFKRKFMSFPIP